jgi:hypothetical protein
VDAPSTGAIPPPISSSASGGGHQSLRLALAGVALLTLALSSGAFLNLTVRAGRSRPRT